MLSKSPLLRSVPAVLSVAVGCALVWWAASVHSLDFNVYRAGARAFLGLDGSAQLYDEKLWNIAGDAWLPFTYPPFAVLLFLPYAVMPAETGAHIHSVILLMSLLAVAHLIITRSKGIAGLLQRRTDWRAAVLPGLVVVLIGISGPWREGLSFGQINAALMVILLADLLGARKMGLPRGLLTGLAAGVKLTPLALGLFFLAQRDFKALLWMAAGFFGSVAAGFTISAEGSVYYWTEALWTASRVGTVDDMYNATLRSFTLHLGLPEHAATALWIALSLAAVLCGYGAIRRLLAAGELLAAVGAAALVMLVISPISWYHHWVWFILLLPALISPPEHVSRLARRRMRVGAAGLYALFLTSSYTMSLVYFGRIQGHGPWWMELLSSIWLFAAIAAAATITKDARPSLRTPSDAPPRIPREATEQSSGRAG